MNTVNLTKTGRRWLAAFAIAAVLAISAFNSPFFVDDNAGAASGADAVAGFHVPGLTIG